MNKIKMIFSTFKTFKICREEFRFMKRLSAKTFQVLVPNIMKGELNLKDFSTFKSFRTLKMRVCFKEFFYSKHFWKLSLFLFNFSLHFPTSLAMKTMVVFTEKGGCERVKEGVHRFPCQGPFFGFLVRKAPCTL